MKRMLRCSIISLHVFKFEDLFDKDPASGEPTLIPKYSDYILIKTKMIKMKEPILLKFFLRNNENTEFPYSSFYSYFSRLLDTEKQELQMTRRNGLLSLMVGFLFALIMVSAANFFKGMTETAFLKGMLESLSIFGTVALWRPAEILLYEWIPHYGKIRLFERLSDPEKTKIEVVLP